VDGGRCGATVEAMRRGERGAVRGAVGGVGRTLGRARVRGGGGGGAGRSAWISHGAASRERERDDVEGGAARVAEAEMARLQNERRDEARRRASGGFDAVIDDEAEECEGDVVVVR